MIVSSTASTPKLRPTNLSEMTTADIDALLDVHVFGHAPWCFGRAKDLQWSGRYICEICGAPNERHLAEVIFEDRGHPRRVPRYSMEEILEAMRARDRGTQVAFTLAVMAAIDHSARVSQATAWLRVLNALSSRLLGEAALRALGVIDEQGYVRGRASEAGAQLI